MLRAGEVVEIVEIGPATDSVVVEGHKSCSAVSILRGGTKLDPDVGLKRGAEASEKVGLQVMAFGSAASYS